jgi:glycosyltransferase involved in cell wall biosynthesis
MNTEAYRLVNGPLVSIGMPVYNGEPFIRQAIDSVLAQTYQHLEIIISDNASTDATAEISLEYAAKDQRIKYFRNPLNLGVYANFRAVVALASGEYFMWAAIDDLKPPDSVARCVQALLQNARAVMAHGNVLVCTAGGETLVEYRNEVHATSTSAAARVRRFTYGLRHNAMLYGLYRREALTQGRLGNHLGQDYLLCLQMCLLGAIEYVGTPIIIYRERQTIGSSSPMYKEAPVTLTHLLTASRVYRRKCWTVLLLGCYYLATIGKVPWSERLGAIAAHVTTFAPLHRSRFATEIVYQLFEPVVWLSVSMWRLARRWSVTFRLARKVQARVMRV